MVTPLMKRDEEVEDLANKFNTAVENDPCVARPDLMVLRHTHFHSEDEPEGWRRPAEGIQKFYRPFDACFGKKTTPKNGFLEPSPEEKFADRPESTPEPFHQTAMIGTSSEVIEHIRRPGTAGDSGTLKPLAMRRPPQGKRTTAGLPAVVPVAPPPRQAVMRERR